MKRLLIRSGLAALAMMACLAASYLLTWGHYFLPLPSSAEVSAAPAETRSYSPEPIPAHESSLGFRIWQIRRPGAALMLRAFAAGEVESLEQALSLRYPFPPGTRASFSDIEACWKITHHPAMLDRMEKDLALKRVHP